VAGRLAQNVRLSINKKVIHAYMTKQQFIKTLNQISKGEMIPGTIAGKSYKFKGIQKYSGRGRYSNLKGKDVIVLHSDERK
jgi:hypothetical protein